MALSTAWQRVATGQRVVTGLRVGGSHLSPDGGGLSRAAVHRLGADGYALKVTTALRLRDGKDRSS